MSPSSEPVHRRGRQAGAVTAMAIIGLFNSATASALPPDTTTAVVPITTSVVTFEGGTAELDGSTTLEHTRTGTRSRIDCTILFAKDSDRLRAGAKDKLHRLATQLHRQGPGRVQVTGYTDNLGSAAHGLDLSRRRAQRVATELRGILPETTYPTTVRGRGEADPAVVNTTETNRRKNRRVTVTLTHTAATPHRATSEPQAPPATQPTPPPTTASAPSNRPSDATPPPSQPTSQRNPPTPPPTHPPSTHWPLTAGLALALVLIGTIADQLRRKNKTARGAEAAGASASESASPVDGANAIETPSGEEQVETSTAPAPTAALLGPATEPSTTPGPTTSTEPAGAARAAKDPTAQLDADVAAWSSADTRRPRLTLLGPVNARTRGQALARRKPYYTELLAYLTLKTHGATVDEIADTFTLTTARVRTDMKILRDWLGVDPNTGQPYLPDARNSLAALQRGLPAYQVSGVLCDWLLFTQLQTRAATATPEANKSEDPLTPWRHRL